MRQSPPTRCRQRGNALVEFAVILPCLTLLLLLGGEGAGMLSTYEVLVNAARAGVRVSVTPGEMGHAQDVINRVLSYASANGVSLSGGNVSVQQFLPVAEPGGAGCTTPSAPCILSSQVIISDQYSLRYLPALPFGIPTTVPLRTAAVMRNFY